MAPSLPNPGGETPSQRTRSKSDADIDYAPQGMSAFISTMLVMFFAVIRRALDLASQSTSPLDLGLHHSASSCLSYDAFLSRRTRFFHKPNLTHLYYPTLASTILPFLHYRTSTFSNHFTGLSTILTLYRRVLF